MPSAGDVFFGFDSNVIFDDVMTLHRLHAGDGYLYLTSQVATGDRVRDRTRDLTDYYLEHGTPPGVWMGAGAAALGISGEVTEAQMQALFGEGLHPNADAIIAAAIANGKTVKQAIEAAQIGRMFYEYSTESSPIREICDGKIDEFTATWRRRPNWDERTILRTDAAREHLTDVLGHPPTRSEINDALAAEKTRTRKAVAGFDCVFTPQKSISILWGLGSDHVRERIWRCHLEAVQEVLAFAESRYAVTRRGRNGVMQIDATGLIIAAFQHFDNRAGDMNPHTHAVISGRVLGVDGKWSALDARSLYAAAVSLSCRYNATLVGKLKRTMGFHFEARSRGRGKQPVLEVVGVSEDMIGEFSRRDDIIARFEHLAAQYRATHGHNPKLVTQYRLAQQATLETRSQKPLPKSLRQMLIEWDARYQCVFGAGRNGREFVDQLWWAHTHPDAPHPFDPGEATVAVGVGLGGVAGVLTVTPERLEQAITAQLDRCVFGSVRDRTRAHAVLVAALTPEPDEAVLEQIRTAHEAQGRAVYAPEPIAVEVADIVAHRRATWTEANIRSAVEDRLAVCEFADDDAERAAVEHVTTLVRDAHSLQLSVDPDPVPAAMARASGESIFTVTGATRYTSTAVLDAETRLLDAAREPTGCHLTANEVDTAIRHLEKNNHRLNPGQRAIARYLCTTDTRLAVAVGPAGSGKTTAMRAVADAWQATGRTVIALAPSASAARELGASLHTPARTLHKLFAQNSFGVPTGLCPGAMLLVDEAAMAATFDLDALLRLAREHGAIIRGVGDPEQISAVESGGIIRTIAHDTDSPELSQLVRFTDPDEAEATLAVRAGKVDQAWEFYDPHGRVTHGMSHQLREQILTAHLTDTAAGISSVMIAATLNDVSALNTATQAAHLASGRVRADHGRIGLSDKHFGYVGDLVVTRANNPHLKIIGGIRQGTGIDNGDLWRIHRIHHDGSITVTGTSHRGHVLLPADYINEHVELGYATTAHRAQGITVRRARVLLNATLGRALAYVGLTRGWEINHLYLATDALVDISGDQQPDDPQEPFRCFARVLAREDDNRSATDIMREEQAAADHRVRTSYQHTYHLLADARAAYLLDRALPTVFFHDAKNSPHYQLLLDTIALADAHQLDTDELVTVIATNNYEDLGKSLATARDTAAVLRARADRWIQQRLTPIPNPLTVAPVETLATASTYDLTDLIARLNALPVLTTPAATRFRALRDAPFPGPCRPVPTRWPTADADLLDYATELRRRILGPNADTSLDPASAPDTGAHNLAEISGAPQDHFDIQPPAIAVCGAETLTATAIYDPSALIAKLNTTETLTPPARPAHDTALAAMSAADTEERFERLRADYHSYVKELADQHTDRRLYRALPAVLYRLAIKSQQWSVLLDTIALADTHQLDTNTLIATITTDNYNDLGASLLLVRDPARELRNRADIWIGQQFPDDETAHERPFHALADLPYRSEFRPVPDYPDRNEQLADFAYELRQRAEKLRQRIQLTQSRTPTVQPPEIKNPPPPDKQSTVVLQPTPAAPIAPKPTTRLPRRVPPATRGRPRRRGL